MALFKTILTISRVANSNQANPLDTMHSRLSPVHLVALFRQHEPIRWKRFSHSMEAADLNQSMSSEPRRLLLQKRLRVAIVGRPNAGKSTLINRILNLNVCDVSPKTHTTRNALMTPFTKGDTQIVFVDTPGLITKKEFSRFNLSDEFFAWKKEVFNNADIIGIIHEVTSPKDVLKLHLNLVQSIHDLPESKPVFMILNKVDMVIDKVGLSEAITTLTRSTDEEEVRSEVRRVWKKFSKIFVISALKNIGVEEVVSFLLEQAKPGEWDFRPSEVCDKPLHVLVKDLLRAQVMAVLPNEVPYKCQYGVEYMKENDLGEIICVATINCDKERHFKMLVQDKKSSLRRLAKTLESDLYKIVGKVFKLRIVSINTNKKSGK